MLLNLKKEVQERKNRLISFLVLILTAFSASSFQTPECLLVSNTLTIVNSVYYDSLITSFKATEDKQILFFFNKKHQALHMSFLPNTNIVTDFYEKGRLLKHDTLQNDNINIPDLEILNSYMITGLTKASHLRSINVLYKDINRKTFYITELWMYDCLSLEDRNLAEPWMKMIKKAESIYPKIYLE